MMNTITVGTVVIKGSIDGRAAVRLHASDVSVGLVRARAFHTVRLTLFPIVSVPIASAQFWRPLPSDSPTGCGDHRTATALSDSSALEVRLGVARGRGTRNEGVVVLRRGDILFIPAASFYRRCCVTILLAAGLQGAQAAAGGGLCVTVHGEAVAENVVIVVVANGVVKVRGVLQELLDVGLGESTAAFVSQSFAGGRGRVVELNLTVLAKGRHLHVGGRGRASGARPVLDPRVGVRVASQEAVESSPPAGPECAW